MLLTLRCDPEREFCFYPVFFVGTPPFSLKRRAFFVLQRLGADFRCFWNVLTNPRNCPHCGQKWTGWRRKAPGLSPAFSPQRPKSLDFDRFQRFPAFTASGFSHCRSCQYEHFSPTLPHVGATSGLRASGGYTLGWAAKVAQTANTGATGCDWRFVCALNLCFQQNRHIFVLPHPRPVSASVGHSPAGVPPELVGW